MAITTEIEPQTPVLVPPATPKRKHVATGKKATGRPRIETDEPEETASADAGDIDGAVDDSGDIWIHLLNLTPDEWTRRLGYLIRLAPTTEKRSGGRGVSIATYACPFDRDKIMKEHGSGVYRLDFLIQNQHTGKYTRYRQERFDINNPDYPPNIPYGEWIERPENEAWKWAGPKLLALEAAQAAGTAPLRANGTAYPPGFNIADMMDKADQRALRMVEIMTPKKDAEEKEKESLLLKLIDVATARNNAPAPPPPDTKQTDRLFEMLLEDRKQAREELALLRERLLAPPVAQKSIIEQFIELRPQIKDLFDAFATRSGKTDIWAEIAKEGVSQIPDLITLGRDMLNKQPAQQQQQRQVVQAPNTQPTPKTQQAQPQQVPTTERQQLDNILQMHGHHINMLIPSIVEFFKVGDGFGMRDWYLPLHGLLNWSELRRQIGPELFRNILVAQPPLAQELGPPEALLKFMEEFFTEPGQDEDDADGVLGDPGEAKS